MAWAGAAFNLFLYMLASHTISQSTFVRLEEMRVKREIRCEWMSHRLLPENLRERMRRCQCLKKLMSNYWMQCVIISSLHSINQESYLVREGDPVDEMLFIMRGKLLTVTTNGGRTGFLNSEYLKASNFCGEELLTWALDPHSSNLPISTRTVWAIT
ncbi:hypothetical protein IFM89_019961 [Coptis chinensis]|uniref:Cyclic nucleotide-binding domain-containing protein n=1 Tax=Coptis chinensis TaxID=261450 RepID=A0A835LJ73_9MAGN|nr:hypothetical protein IFM89_019961 [Coptis chinensis]